MRPSIFVPVVRYSTKPSRGKINLFMFDSELGQSALSRFSSLFKFQTGGWLTADGRWGLLWEKTGKVEVPTQSCKVVDFRTKAGQVVKAWKCK